MQMIFATRPSALARWQTQWVVHRLQQAWPDLTCETVIITTQGDRELDRPLPEIGGKGLFTFELESELRDGKVDAAVHSLKDLPVDSPAGLAIGAMPPRVDARDVLVSPDGYTLDTLPSGAFVGTSSLRRKAQLLAYRPDLTVTPLRGNVDTRLRKAQKGDYAAIVLAGAGVLRLGLGEHITQWLPLDIMLPAPGQGALAVQCRDGDQAGLRILAAIDDVLTRQTTRAERSFLAGLGGGCSLPIGTYATFSNGVVDLQAVLVSLDGKEVIRLRSSGEQPEELGARLAREAVARGAQKILHQVASR